VDEDELIVVATALLSERPRTRSELAPLLAERWPDHDPAALAYGATYLLPLVQVTPRGLWRRSGRSAFTTLDAWLGPAAASEATVDDLVLRYLAAFGPATVADVQAWSGLPAMRPVLDGLRPRLRTFRDERARELFDVPDAPLPAPRTAVPVRFLPEYDNVFLGHADRTRIVAHDHRKRMFDVGWGQILVDGFLTARWRTATDERGRLVVQPYRPLTASERAEIAEEGEKLIAFLETEEPRRGVRFLPI
jgi:hypothetical protein